MGRMTQKQAIQTPIQFFAGVLWVVLALFSGGSHATGQPGTTTYYYTDPQGTVLAKTDGSGNVISQSDYRPYGVQAIGSPEDGPSYTGHVSDADSALVYMQARYYDPSVGRFLSTDPASLSTGSIAGFSRYSYGSNNPSSTVDPDGRNAVTAFGGLLYETSQWITGNGFDGSHLEGALADGYNGQGDGFAMSAFQDATTFIPAGTAAKGVELVRASAAEGKVAQLIANRAAGKAAEATAKRELISEGNEILGSQVSVNTSAGRRVIDHLIKTPENNIVAVEVKAGNATRSAAQLLKDSKLATEGGKLVGKNAPVDLRGEIIKIETIERNYPL